MPEGEDGSQDAWSEERERGRVAEGGDYNGEGGQELLDRAADSWVQCGQKILSNRV